MGPPTRVAIPEQGQVPLPGARGAGPLLLPHSCEVTAVRRCPRPTRVPNISSGLQNFLRGLWQCPTPLQWSDVQCPMFGV